MIHGFRLRTGSATVWRFPAHPIISIHNSCGQATVEINATAVNNAGFFELCLAQTDSQGQVPWLAPMSLWAAAALA